jgi:hypothetical protein
VTGGRALTLVSAPAGFGKSTLVSAWVDKRGVFGIATSHTGSQITYDMLIREAQALGADDIINVRIDRLDRSVHSTVPFFEWIVGYTEQCTYTGTALAIRYKEAIPAAPSS